MKVSSISLCAVLLFGWCGLAQDEPVAEGVDSPGETPAQSVSMVPPPAVPDSQSDEIHLKSGSVLKDVQVLRRSPLGFEVQVTPGVSFFLPRRQVVEIKYDDAQPSVEPLAAVEQRQSTFFGAKLEPLTFDKLNAPLPDSCLNSMNRCIVEMMALISEETGVKIEAADAVMEMPEQARLWDFALEPGTTLSKLLQSNLPERFPELAIVYQYDTIIITTREGAAVQETSEAGTMPAPASADNS